MDQQIDTELTRLESAKLSLKDAIEAKGVEVPEEALLDSYATYVLTIPSSGSSEPDFTAHPDAYMAYNQPGPSEYTYITDPTYIEALAAGNGGSTLANGWEIWFSPKVQELTQITTLNNFLTPTWEGDEPQEVSFIRVEGIENFTSVTTIGDRFLSNAAARWPIALPPNATSFGDQFMASMQYYDYPLVLPVGLVSIGDSFLSGCLKFNQPLTFPNTLTTIGEGFLNAMDAYNQPIVLPNSVTSLGSNFVCYMNRFNQPITLSDALTSLPSHSLTSLTVFNQPVVLPEGLTTIGDYCFNNLAVFNSPITLPNSLTSIGEAFLLECPQFNQPLTLPEGLTELGDYFLRGDIAFAQPLELPATLATIGTSNGAAYFMSAISEFVGPLTINNPTFPFSLGSKIQDKTWMLSSQSETATSYVQGITIQGPGKEAWWAEISGTSTWPMAYRRIIYGAD